MTLLELSGGRLSLEFARDEWNVVRDRLAAQAGPRGSVNYKPMATYDVVRVAGEDLLLLNDWDQPCLISRSAGGDQILRWVESGSIAMRPSRAAKRKPSVVARKVRAA